MKNTWVKALCRLLAAAMIWLPYQVATAGMIDTKQASGAPSERHALASTVARADVLRELQALGVDASAAQARVALLTDEEARTLARDVQNAPAGGVYAAGIIAILLIVGLGYAWYKHYNPY